MFDFLQREQESIQLKSSTKLRRRYMFMSDRMGSKSMAERFTASSRKIFHR